MFYMIVAKDLNGVIGKDGNMPWGRDLPADLQHFRKVTWGHTVIMGRKTFESIGKPLPGRENIVLSRKRTFLSDFPEVRVMDFDGVMAATFSRPAFIIGGQEIYELFAPIASKAFITVVEHEFEGDAYFPPLPGVWEVVASRRHLRDDQNKYSCTFYLYEKR
ncbi:dihydrofolate reductase [Laceyella tengchongensis]|jgi:dihydrofolate reductase|uniref:dihydrofolate reductase n=1 Tax=Laceyella tengchongensis TaxID=574699 RepID=UPI0012B75B8A|nr:dihydrofolate reductase [Laceyella tengchongensis]